MKVIGTLKLLLGPLKLFEQGDFKSFVQDNPERLEVVQQFRAAMDDLRPAVANLGRPEIQQILQTLAPLEAKLAWLASDANHFSGERVAEDQRELLRLHWMFASVTCGLILCGLALGGLLLWQNRLLSLAQGQLHAATQAKAEFLAAMSHEIRTPLTGMLGMLDVLATEQLSDKQQGYVRAIRTSGRHLLALVSDVLDFSRIEAGKLELEEVDFSIPALLESVETVMAPQAIERGLELRFELDGHAPPIVKGDPTRIKQVLINLVGNGLKFTRRGGVTVSVSYSPAVGPQLRVRFDVRDTGIGISEEKRAELFNAFVQADASTTRRYGGSGLGLAISKRLVEAMDGTIGFDSLPGV